MIELSSVSLKLKNNIVLNNLNLKINEGDKIGLFGPNGSGKTRIAQVASWNL